MEKVENLDTNSHDKTKYVIHMRNTKQAINHGLVFLKKIHRVIKFNQKAWLKPYTDISTKLRKKAKDNFKKDVFKLINNALFGKTIENVRKQRNIKLAITEWRRNYLVSEPIYHATDKHFHK